MSENNSALCSMPCIHYYLLLLDADCELAKEETVIFFQKAVDEMWVKPNIKQHKSQ